MASITDVVKEGLKYPFNDGKKVLILGIIFLVSSLVSMAMEFLDFDNMRILANVAPVDTVQAAISAMPPSNMALIVLSWIVTFILMVFASGYIYDVIKYGIEGKSELPEFSDIKGLLVKGLRAFVVGLAYSILPMILFFLGLMLTVNESVGASVNAIGGIILLLAIVFAIFVSMFEVIAMCNMVAKDELKAAFNFSEILALIKNLGWGKLFGILLFAVIAVMILVVFLEFIFGGISLLISMVIGSAMALVIVKIIFDSLLINPYVSIVISRIYGSIYRQANDLELKTVKEAESDA